MSTHRYVYEKVSWQAIRTVGCTVCGKAMRRQRTFTKTVNPFNRTVDGTPKTYAQVRADVIAEANLWEPPNEVCSKCEPRP